MREVRGGTVKLRSRGAAEGSRGAMLQRKTGTFGAVAASARGAKYR
jgi:hypothetical protein